MPRYRATIGYISPPRAGGDPQPLEDPATHEGAIRADNAKAAYDRAQVIAIASEPQLRGTIEVRQQSA